MGAKFLQNTQKKHQQPHKLIQEHFSKPLLT
jgi:hypothetical protein